MHREGLAWRSAAETSELRARSRAALDPDDYEQAWREGEDLTLSDVVRAAVDLDAS
jgi:hypothetical protein